jgi:hypothetical protein
MNKYQVHTQTVSQNKQIDSTCNAIEFVNDGDQSVLVNGRLLIPQAAFSYYGLKDETDTTVYNIVFIGAPGADPRVTVIRKIYIA